MIRLAEVPGLNGTSLGLPSVSAQAIAAPAVALGHLAQSIADVAQPFHKVALQVQANENAVLESQRRTQLSEGYAQLSLDLQRDPDPQSHLDRVNAFLGEHASTFDDPDLPPVLRQRLGQHFTSFASAARIRTAENAARLSTKRAGLAVQSELQAAKEAGDPDRYNEAIATGRDAGILLPEHEDALQADFRQHTTFRQMVRTIDADPLGSEEQLADPDFLDRYPDLKLENLDKLRRYAGQQANGHRAEFWDGVLNAALDQGEGHSILSLEDLGTLAEQGDITPQQRASYIRSFHAPEPPVFDPVLYEGAAAAIGTYDPASDPTGALLATLRGNIATLPLPDEHLAELRSRLSDRAKPPSSRTTQHRLGGDFSRLTTEYFNQGKFGDWFTLSDHDNDPRTADRQVIDLPSYHAALAAQRTFRDAWEGYLETAPADLDPVQAQEAFKQLHQQSIDAAPALDLGIPDAGAPPIDYERRVNDALGIPPQSSNAPTGASGALPGELAGYTQSAREAARLHGLPEDDFLAALSEASNGGTSNLLATHRNAAGTTGPSGPLAYPSLEASIAAYAAAHKSAKPPTLNAADWGATEADWFAQAQPTDPHTISLGLGVLRDAWTLQHYDDGSFPARGKADTRYSNATDRGTVTGTFLPTQPAPPDTNGVLPVR
jgi:hypothetical protein